MAHVSPVNTSSTTATAADVHARLATQLLHDCRDSAFRPPPASPPLVFKIRWLISRRVGWTRKGRGDGMCRNRVLDRRSVAGAARRPLAQEIQTLVIERLPTSPDPEACPWQPTPSSACIRTPTPAPSKLLRLGRHVAAVAPSVLLLPVEPSQSDKSPPAPPGEPPAPRWYSPRPSPPPPSPPPLSPPPPSSPPTPPSTPSPSPPPTSPPTVVPPLSAAGDANQDMRLAFIENACYSTCVAWAWRTSPRSRHVPTLRRRSPSTRTASRRRSSRGAASAASAASPPR